MCASAIFSQALLVYTGQSHIRIGHDIRAFTYKILSDADSIIREAQRMSVIKISRGMNGSPDHRILFGIKHYSPVSQLCRNDFKASGFYILRFYMFCHDCIL